SFRQPDRIPMYAHVSNAEGLQKIFRYIFDEDYKYGGIARVKLNHINGRLELFGAQFEPISILHGDAEIHGYRFGSAAYLTDFSAIPEESMERLRGLDILFLDALRHKPHPTHSTVQRSIAIAEQLAPRRTYFTHICHELPHARTESELPQNIHLAYDGLEISVGEPL